MRPLNKPGAKSSVERVALDDLHGQPKVVAALHLRTIGQHTVGGQECGQNCVYLFPGVEYQLRVSMMRNGSPKISVPVAFFAALAAGMIYGIIRPAALSR